MLTIIKPEYCFGSWENVAFSLWHGELTNAHIPLFEKEWGAVQTAHPQGFGVITIVAPDAKGIETSARKAVSELYKSFGKTLKGASIVLGMTGLKGTAARFIINTLRLGSGGSYPMEAHESLKDATKWIGERLDIRDPFKELSKMTGDYEEQRTIALRNITR